MLICPRCGSPADTGQVFCRSCGAPLNEDVPVTSLSLTGPPENPSEPSPVSLPARPVQATAQPETPPLRSPLQLAGIAVILIIIATAAFLFLSGFPLSAGARNSTGMLRGSGTQPVNGQCQAGFTLCSGTCVDLMTDRDNCGACGFAVPYGETCRNGQFSSSYEGTGNSTTTAESALLSATADGMQVSCPAGRSPCSGSCTDPANDAAHCGSCGNACPSGQLCQNARCVLQSTWIPVATTSASVAVTPELSCSGREMPCGNACVDVFSDKNNCGVCGRACKSQEICVNAQCGPACTENGMTLCGETCVDLDTDMDNCGACGTECETFLPNAGGPLCSYGQCIISLCKTGYANCNEKIPDGCEISILTDAANCGACGAQCPAGKVCYNGKCSVPIGT